MAKRRIFKLNGLHELFRLPIEKGVTIGEKIIISVPRRKGMRKLVRGVLSFRPHQCDCCVGGTYYLDK